MRELSLEELNLVSGGDGTAGSPPDPTLGGTLQQNPANLQAVFDSITPVYPLVGTWYADSGKWCTLNNDGEEACLPPGQAIIQAGGNPDGDPP